MVFDELRNRDLPAARAALKDNPALLIATDDEGRTPLLFAALEGYLDAVRLCISELGADVTPSDVVRAHVASVAHLAVCAHTGASRPTTPRPRVCAPPPPCRLGATRSPSPQARATWRWWTTCSPPPATSCCAGRPSRATRRCTAPPRTATPPW